MKNGMIIELPDYGKIQVIGDVMNGKLLELWGIGLLNMNRTMMRSEMDHWLISDVLSACRKKDLEQRYEESKKVYLTHVERLECVKDAVERLGENIDVKV